MLHEKLFLFLRSRGNLLFINFRFFRLVFLALVFVVASCSESSSYEVRLQSFYQLLDPQTISSFEQGDLDSVARYLEQKRQDAEFADKYEALKKREAINLFTSTQTVEFFYKYFYQKNNE